MMSLNNVELLNFKVSVLFEEGSASALLFFPEKRLQVEPTALVLFPDGVLAGSDSQEDIVQKV